MTGFGAASALHPVERYESSRLICQPFLNLGYEPRRNILAIEKMDLVARRVNPT